MATNSSGPGNQRLLFSTPELLALWDQLEVSPVANPVLAPIPEGLEPALKTWGQSILRARGVINDSGEVLAGVAELIRTNCQPGIEVVARRDRTDSRAYRRFAVTPDVGIAEEAVTPSIAALEYFPPAQLLDQIEGFAGCGHAATPETQDELLVTVATMRECEDLIARDSHENAASLLEDGGVDRVTSTRLLEAIAARQAMVSLSVFHRPEVSRLEGGVLAWLDSGASGLWLTEPDETEETARVRLRNVGSADLRAAIAELLPPAFLTRVEAS